MDSLVGSILDDRYKIISLLGEGGMSAVYKADDMIMQNCVALKLLKYDEQGADTNLKRFQQEALALSTLKHRNIVAVHRFGKTADGRMYLVLDFVSGQTLEDLLAKDGPLLPERALKFFIQISDALVSMHKAGIVHRDLKPSNLMLMNDESGIETVKIVDFGVVMNLARKDQHLTGTGRIVGSPLYMSPEQWSSKPVDQRSDIYSLGCVMYECILGTVPFEGERLLNAMYDAPKAEEIKKQANALKKMNISASFSSIIMKSIKFNADERYQSVDELLKDLQSVVGRTESVTGKTGRNLSSVSSGFWQDLQTGRPVVVIPMLLVIILTLYYFSIDELGVMQVRSLWFLVQKALIHPSDESMMKELASFAKFSAKCGDYKRARALFAELFDLKAKVFGPDSLEVAFACDDAAGAVYDYSKMRDDAKSYYQESLRILGSEMKKLQGKMGKEPSAMDSPKIADAWYRSVRRASEINPNNLWNTFYLSVRQCSLAEQNPTKDNLNRAKNLLELVCEFPVKLPNEKASLAQVSVKLATILCIMGEDKQAIRCLEQTKRLLSESRCENQQGIDTIFSFMDDLFQKYNAANNFRCAGQVLKIKYETCLSVYGNSSPHVGNAALCLADYYYGQVCAGRRKFIPDAIKYFEQGIDVLKNDPANVERLAYEYANLGHSYALMQNYDMAIKNLLMAMSCCQQPGWKLLKFWQACLKDCADNYGWNHDFKGAVPLVEKCIRFLKQTSGEDSPDLMFEYRLHAYLLCTIDHFPEAKAELLKAIELGNSSKQLNGDQQLELENCRRLLGDVENVMAGKPGKVLFR